MADDIKKKFEKVKDLAKKKPDNDFLNSLLEQMAEGHELSSKQEEVLKEIEKEVKEMGDMKKYRAGDTEIERFSASQINPDTRRKLDPFRVLAFV